MRQTLFLAAAMIAGLGIQAARGQDAAEETLPGAVEAEADAAGARDGAAMPGRTLPPRLAPFDGDGDGVLDAAERDALQAARFAEADADGNGALTADELAAWFEAQAAQRRSDRAERLVARLDTDGDGSVDAEELAAAPVLADGDREVGDRMAARFGDRGRGDHGPRGHWFGDHGPRGRH
ncbi:EF-hand domain-containing protein [Wenxinia saemankumensis]|uniref:EF-hand domain pair n=1 Tax=Wenxinia saemankumensis TaxID=1447782 RepID=A0A1M6CSQ2_9RHOB|nr:EF-hand domain-containing protein [Wenxinia saemankumensis]SHI64042.1 EF-hand domain pair [Wenxinia saemankumensis]